MLNLLHIYTFFLKLNYIKSNDFNVKSILEHLVDEIVSLRGKIISNETDDIKNNRNDGLKYYYLFKILRICVHSYITNIHILQCIRWIYYYSTFNMGTF